MAGAWRSWSALAGLALAWSLGPAVNHASSDNLTATYDTLNRLRTVTYCDGRVLTYTYDAAGNRTSYVATPPTLTAAVSAPNGGETWIVGSTNSITWSGIGLGASVEISLSRDNAATWQSILASTPNDGTQNWTISGPPTAGARIRVRSTSCRAISDTSDAAFVIQAPGAPVVTTPTSGSLAGTAATLGATVVTDGGGVITERGVVYSATSTNADPAIGGAGVSKALTIGTTGVFTVGVTGLSPGTAYTFRGYAINAGGTAYSTSSSFTTLAPPTMIAPTLAGLTSTTATVGGQVTSNGGAAITERGVVWSLTSTNNNPTIGGAGVTKVASAGTTGVFTVNLAGLNLGTGYTFRAFATNSQGVVYTAATNFTTHALPTMASPTAISVLATSATLGGTVSGDGGTLILERGVVSSVTTTNSSPTIGGAGSTKVPTSGTTGAFTVMVAGLTSGTGYSFTAYAINSVGVRYTTPATFSTIGAPVIGSPTSSVITSNSATLGGNVTSDGGSAITARGVVFAVASTNSLPVIGGVGVTVASGSAATGVFALPVTGLSPGTAYAFRAFATNVIGTTYTTPATTFTTLAAPTVTTPSATALTSTAATLGGNVSGDGGSTILERGVVYSQTGTNGNPLINGAGVTKLVGTGTTGSFTVVATSLTTGTGYSYKAYAINAVGTTYTTVATFTTLAVPSVTSPTAGAVTHNAATLGGNVTSDGGGPITERGVVYSVTSANANPQVGGPNVVKVPTAGTTGVFTVNAVGLAAGTGYSFKAYAINSVGTTHTSATGIFTTLAAPTVTTPTAASITSIGATLGGNVTSDGGSPITARGIVYAAASTNSEPVIGGPGVNTASGSAATGVFALPLTGLSPGTLYAFRAFATNAVGTTYTTPATTFTTLAAPTVTTPSASAITSTTATLGGNVASDGGSAILERGVVYSQTSTNGNPLLNGAGVTKRVGTGTTGSFTVAATSLITGTGYSFKAYATNAVDTSYTSVATFTTPAVPTVTSPTASAVTHNAATLGGNVTSDGGGPITERGVVYSVTSANANPQVGGSNVVKVPTAGTTGVFTVNAVGLAAGTGYSFKAYAINSVGTAHTSATSTFTTLAVPTVTTPAATSITSIGATLGGNVTSDGGSPITARGVVYAVASTNSEPVIGGPGVSVASGSAATGIFALPVTGLSPGTLYAFRAFATNAVGTTYTTPATTFTTLAAPTVTAPSASAITSTTATLGGNVAGDGGSAILERGVVYSQTSANGNPLINGAGVTKLVGTGTTGSFTVAATSLTTGTGYSFKAYATNAVDTSYTTVATFTTLAVPSVTSPTSTAVTSVAATLGGNVTSDGGASVTERGVVYSVTTANPSPQVGGADVVQAPTSGTVGVFTVNVAGLAPGTGYSFKAYAINSVGTTHTSASGTFTTLATPSVTAPTAAAISSTAATLGGEVTVDGGSPITERGIVYAVSAVNADPSTGGAGVTTVLAPGTVGVFTVGVGALTPGTVYSFRAYARNSVGPGYTSPVSTFTTLAAPTVAGSSLASIGSTSAVLGGTVAADGGAPVLERGVVYSVAATNGNPQIDGAGVTKLVTGGTTGTFTLPAAGLASGTTYAFRAYAINSVGAGYANVVTFTTLALPAIAAPSSAVGASTATLGGTVTGNGGDVITERGVVYAVTALNSNPQLSGANVTTVPTSGALGTFSVNIAGLASGTQHSFRAYVTNSVGTAYTAPVSAFTTPTTAVVGAPTFSAVTTSGALLGGTVEGDGGSPILERGVVYSPSSTNNNPAIGEPGVVKWTVPGTLGAFTIPAGVLTPGTNYSFRAYATNAVGEGYSPTAEFTTLVQTSVGDVSVMEGDSGTTNAAFTVTLSAPSEETVTVAVEASDLSANVGSDYTATGPVILSFTPGVTTQQFSIPIHGDVASESTETFQVTLSGAVNAEILDGVAIGTITNDDAEPPARVFVSPTGSDAFDCANQNTPCRNLAGAITQVAIDGEVIVLSSGAYDTAPILITKGLKISSPAGAVVFITQPITINAPGGRVALRGLTIEGTGTGNGITLTAAAGLSIEDTTIGRWANGLQIGNAVAAQVSIANSVFRANTAGIRDSGGAAGNRISVEDSRFERNTRGIEVLAGAFMIRESGFIGNTSRGVVVGPGSATIHRSEFSQNATAVATLSGGTVRLSRSRAFGNTLGLSAAAGSTFQSTGTNVVRGNTTNTSGTITTIPEQ